MKRLFLMGGVMVAISLMSFTATVDNPIQRIGEQMYSISAGAKLAPRDQAALQHHIAKAYELSEWQMNAKTIELDFFDARGAKDKKRKENRCANSIFNKKVFLTAVEEKISRYDCTDTAPLPDETDIIGILSQYAG